MGKYHGQSRGTWFFLVRPAAIRYNSSKEKQLGKGLETDESPGDQKKVQRVSMHRQGLEEQAHHTRGLLERGEEHLPWVGVEPPEEAGSGLGDGQGHHSLHPFHAHLTAVRRPLRMPLCQGRILKGEESG